MKGKEGRKTEPQQQQTNTRNIHGVVKAKGIASAAGNQSAMQRSFH